MATFDLEEKIQLLHPLDTHCRWPVRDPPVAYQSHLCDDAPARRPRRRAELVSVIYESGSGQVHG